MIVQAHHVAVGDVGRRLARWPGHGQGSREQQDAPEVEVHQLWSGEIGGVGDQHDGGDQHEHGNGGIVLVQVDDVGLRALGLLDHPVHVQHVADCEAGPIGGIGSLDADRQIRLPQGQQVVGTVATHADFPFLGAQPAGEAAVVGADVLVVLLLVLPDDEGLVLGGNSGEDLDGVAEERGWAHSCYEVVVDGEGVDALQVVPVLVNLHQLLCEIVVDLRLGDFQLLDGGALENAAKLLLLPLLALHGGDGGPQVSPSLQKDHLLVSPEYARPPGRLHCYVDVVARDHLGVDVRVYQPVDGEPGIVLEPVLECDQAERADVLYVLLPVGLEVLLDLPEVLDLLVPHGNGPEPIQRQILHHFHVDITILRVLADITGVAEQLLRGALGEDVVPILGHIPHQDRHGLELRLKLVDLEHFQVLLSFHLLEFHPPAHDFTHALSLLAQLHLLLQVLELVGASDDEPNVGIICVMDLRIDGLKHLRVDFVAQQLIVDDLRGVACREQLPHQTIAGVAQLVNYVMELQLGLILDQVDLVDFDLTAGQCASLVEAEGLHLCAVDGLLGLRADDLLVAEPGQRERVGHVEEDWQRGRRRGGQEVHELEEYENPLNVYPDQQEQSSEKGHHAHDYYLQHKHQGGPDNIGILDCPVHDLPDDPAPVSRKPCVDNNCVGVASFGLQNLRPFINPHIAVVDVIYRLDPELADGKVLARKIGLIDIDVAQAYNTVSRHFAVLIRNEHVPRHHLIAVDGLGLAIPNDLHLLAPQGDLLDLLVADVQHDVVDGSGQEREEEQGDGEGSVPLHKKHEAEEVLQNEERLRHHVEQVLRVEGSLHQMFIQTISLCSSLHFVLSQPFFQLVEGEALLKLPLELECNRRGPGLVYAGDAVLQLLVVELEWVLAGSKHCHNVILLIVAGNVQVRGLGLAAVAEEGLPAKPRRVLEEEQPHYRQDDQHHGEDCLALAEFDELPVAYLALPFQLHEPLDHEGLGLGGHVAGWIVELGVGAEQVVHHLLV